MFEYTLENGSKISSPSRTELISLLNQLGVILDVPEYYRSSDGEIHIIKDMHPNHLKNATFRLYKQWLDEVSKLSPDEAFKTLFEGPTMSDKNNQLVGLLTRAVIDYSS